MIQEPLLSICIPTFNRAETLRSCLLNVCSQALQQDELMEVVVCDNASTDRTHQVVTDLQLRWPMIKYFANENNIGMLRNIDRVIRHANGQLCWLLGDDDIVLPYALEKIIEAIGEVPNIENFSFGCTNAFVVSPTGEEFLYTTDIHCALSNRFFEYGAEIFCHLDYHSVGHISRLIVNRKAWLEFDYNERKDYEIFSFVRVLIKMTKGRSTFYLKAPIIGGRNKHSVSYYANHIPLAFVIEFPEFDKLCQSELGLSYRQLLPMMKARRLRTLKGALKMLVFQREYMPYLAHLKNLKFSLPTERILIWMMSRLFLNKNWSYSWLRRFVERRQSNPISNDASIHRSV